MFCLPYATIRKSSFLKFKFNNGILEALSSPKALQNFWRLHESIRKTRIIVDKLGCRYEDYLVGIVEYTLDRNRKQVIQVTPNIHDFAGEDHREAATNYLRNNLASSVCITLDDIHYSRNADFILNYSDTTPEQREKANNFYHDILIPAIERAAANSGERPFDIISTAIDLKLLPEFCTQLALIGHGGQFFQNDEEFVFYSNT